MVISEIWIVKHKEWLAGDQIVLVRWLSAKFWRDLYRADKSTKLCMVVA